MEYNDEIYKLMEDFLDGKLSEEKARAFQNKVDNDAELSEMLKMHKELNEVLNEDKWVRTQFDASNQKSKEYFDFFTDNENKKYLQSLENLDINENLKNKNKMDVKRLFRVAGIAAVLVVGLLLWKNFDSSSNDAVFADGKAIYSEYMDASEIPTFTVRGLTDSVLSLIETSFISKEFEKVNTIISSNESNFDEEQKDLIYIYQGISYGERNMYDKAYESLNNSEIFEGSLYEQMADWYLGMTLLSSNNMGKARELFVSISENENHYKQQEAKTILKKIK